MKNAIGILGVLYIVVLSVALASDPCPAGQYQDRSLSCVNCSSCHTPKDVIRPCDGHNDVICGTSATIERTTQKPKKNKKTFSVKKNQKKSAETGNEGGAFFESANSYNFMLEGPKNKSRKNKDATKVKNGKENEIDGVTKSSNATLPLDKNGKHIKKDLSILDEIHSNSNQTSSRSKLSDVHRNSLSKKNVTKSKKHEDKKQSEEKLSWKPRIIADFVNHRISVEEEPSPSRHFTPVLSNNPSNILNYPLLRSRARLADADEDDDADNAEDEDADEEEYSDDDDDDDEDDNDDYDEDSSTVDGNKDEDDLNSLKRKSDVSKDTLSTAVNDPDINDSEDVTVQNKYDVNVEPFSDTNNWQLLILVLAVSACLLFFVVVNAYLCVYMKKWRHMKQDFEADVEDLSVRINLMQHAGFEADESNNTKNYVTQSKGGRSSTEKVPK